MLPFAVYKRQLDADFEAITLLVNIILSKNLKGMR
jgi:hypothetical protein